MLLEIEIIPDINPKNVGLGRACPRDSKNVSFIDVSKNLVGLTINEIGEDDFSSLPPPNLYVLFYLLSF